MWGVASLLLVMICMAMSYSVHYRIVPRLLKEYNVNFIQGLPPI